MYADNVTRSMEKAISETYRRRAIQEEYNKKHNIIPKTIKKDVKESMVISREIDESNTFNLDNVNKMSTVERKNLIQKLEKDMSAAAKALNFEEAMSLRDIIFELKSM